MSQIVRVTILVSVALCGLASNVGELSARYLEKKTDIELIRTFMEEHAASEPSDERIEVGSIITEIVEGWLSPESYIQLTGCGVERVREVFGAAQKLIGNQFLVDVSKLEGQIYYGRDHLEALMDAEVVKSRLIMLQGMQADIDRVEAQIVHLQTITYPLPMEPEIITGLLNPTQLEELQDILLSFDDEKASSNEDLTNVLTEALSHQVPAARIRYAMHEFITSLQQLVRATILEAGLQAILLPERLKRAVSRVERIEQDLNRLTELKAATTSFLDTLH